MDQLLLILSALNSLVLIILVGIVIADRKKGKALNVLYLYDLKKTKSLLGRKDKLTIKVMTRMGEIPIGEPRVIAEFEDKEIDQERVDELIKVTTDALAKSGISAALKLLG